jgi:hypothetical protein
MSEVFVVDVDYPGEEPVAFDREQDADAYCSARGLQYTRVHVASGEVAAEMIREAQSDE